LDEQTARRHCNARLLDKLLGDVEGVTPQKLDPRCTRNGHYAYIFHLEPKAFACVPVEKLMKALEAEGIPCEPGYPPVHSLDLFQNGAYRQRLGGEQRGEEHAFLKRAYPNAQRAFSETIWIPQPAMLGDEEACTRSRRQCGGCKRTRPISSDCPQITSWPHLDRPGLKSPEFNFLRK
jgi:dTDP-4-amino-4,6-dideoxygalactose transaminase